MTVRGIQGLKLGELIDLVKQGARFVVFHSCVGLLAAPHLFTSPVYFVMPGRRAGWRGIWRTAITVLLGWWAVPDGPGLTLRCLRENLSGGRDVTAGVLKMLAQAEGTRSRAAFDSSAPASAHAA